MSASKITVAPLPINGLPSLRPLVDEFAATHRSLPFKEDYWKSFQEWMIKKQSDQYILALVAHVDGKLAGFGLGTIQETGPLMFPQKIGYVSLLVVAPQFRNVGVGNDWTIYSLIEGTVKFDQGGRRINVVPLLQNA